MTCAVSGAAVVDLPDAHSLLHLADGLERPILYDDDRATYLVEGDAFIYRRSAMPGVGPVTSKRRNRMRRL